MRPRFIAAIPSGALAGALLSLSLLLGASPAAAQADKVAQGLALQTARAKFVVVKAKKVFYTRRWDMSGLPVYQPAQQVSGTIEMWGSNYIQDSNLGKYWEKGFRKYQPGAHIAFHMKTTVAAVPALVFGVADVGVGRKITFAEQLLYERYTGGDPLTITAATGSYNVTGWQPGYGIVVSKDNPLTCLSMQQLDGIFGAERTGVGMARAGTPSGRVDRSRTSARGDSSDSPATGPSSRSTLTVSICATTKPPRCRI